MIKLKIDVLQALKKRGYSQLTIRLEKIFSQRTLGYFRRGDPGSISSLDRLCALLECQPGDLLEYVNEDK